MRTRNIPSDKGFPARKSDSHVFICGNLDASQFYQAPNPNNYGRALMSAPPQAIAPNPHTNLLNVYIQLANKMGFKKKFPARHGTKDGFTFLLCCEV
jgi:hypothetical protein